MPLINRRIVRSIVVRVAAVCLSVATTLFVCELTLRALGWPAEDPVWRACAETAFAFSANLNYRHMQPEYDVAFRTNELGLRDKPVGEKRGERILVLGDSFTCGYGVEGWETFSDLLEQRLGVEVINAGVGGFETIHQTRYFKTQGYKLRPDLVVYALYLDNDLRNNRLWEVGPGNELRRRDGQPALSDRGTPKLICLAKQSVFLRRLAHRVKDEPRETWRPSSRYLALCREPLDAEATEDYRVARELLIELRDAVESAGAKFLVVSFPCRAAVEGMPTVEVDATLDLLRPAREIAEICAAEKIDHLPLTDALRRERRSSSTRLYHACDGHFTAAGHAMVADRLADRLESPSLARNDKASRQ